MAQPMKLHTDLSADVRYERDMQMASSNVHFLFATVPPARGYRAVRERALRGARSYDVL